MHSLLTQHLLRAASYTWGQSVTLFKGEVHALMSCKGLIAALITFMPLIRILYVVWGNKMFYRFDWNTNVLTYILNQCFKQQQQNNWTKKYGFVHRAIQASSGNTMILQIINLCQEPDECEGRRPPCSVAVPERPWRLPYLEMSEPWLPKARGDQRTRGYRIASWSHT